MKINDYHYKQRFYLVSQTILFMDISSLLEIILPSPLFRLLNPDLFPNVAYGFSNVY